MKKREILEKYIDFIIEEQRSGKTLKEIASYFKQEFSIDISPKYISNILKKHKRSRKITVSHDTSIDIKSAEKQKNENIISIYRGSKKIGTLAKNKDIYIFAYEENVDDKEKFIKPGVHYSIPPGLENLLPEGINREILAKKHNINPKDDFEILKYIDDAFGGYTTCPVPKKEYKRFKFNPRKYEETIVTSNNLEVDQDVCVAISEFYFRGESKIVNRLSGLSGQQPKFPVIFYNNRISIPDSHKEHSNAILKVCNKNYQDLNIVENMLLSVARFELGIKTAKTFVLIESKCISSPSFATEYYDHFITERFDREFGKPVQAHELTAILGKTSDEKYNISLEEIFEEVQKIADEDSVKNLAKYFYFSYIAGNGDSHAKNISFFKYGNKYKLAPLYDVVNTSIYGIEGNLGVALYNNIDIKHSDLVEFLSNYVDLKELTAIKNIFFKKIFDYIEKTDIMSGDVKKRLIEFYKTMKEKTIR